MNTELFKEMMKDFSNRVQEQVFTHISKEDWGILLENEDYVNFGYKPHLTYQQRRDESVKHSKSLILFTATFKDNVVSFYVTYQNHFENQLNEAFYDLLLSFFKESNENCFLNLIHGYGPTYARKKRINTFLPIGEQAEEMVHLLEYVKEKGMNVYFWNRIQVETPYHSNRKQFDVTAVFKEKPFLCFKPFNPIQGTSIFISSKEDIDAFCTKVEEKNKLITHYQSSLEKTIKNIDITAFYDAKAGYMVIYNERIPFHIQEIVDKKGIVRYKIRFHQTYNQGKELEKVFKKVETKALDYVKKNRVKAALKGNAYEVFHKFFHKINGFNPKTVTYDSTFETSFSEKEFNDALKQVIEKETIELDRAYVTYFQYYLKSEKRRNVIKSAKKVGNLYAFTSATKLFVLTEEEFETLSISISSIKKPDKQKAQELETWKSSLFSTPVLN